MALILRNVARGGGSAAWCTGSGRCAGIAIHASAATVSDLCRLANVFGNVKHAGAGYLSYLGISSWWPRSASTTRLSATSLSRSIVTDVDRLEAPPTMRRPRNLPAGRFARRLPAQVGRNRWGVGSKFPWGTAHKGTPRQPIRQPESNTAQVTEVSSIGIHDQFSYTRATD